MNKVDAPDVIWMLRSKAYDRAVFEVQTLSLLVAFSQLQAFFALQPFDLLIVIDGPTLDAQQFSELVIAIAAILLS